jgi:hypothetical protein
VGSHLLVENAGVRKSRKFGLRQYPAPKLGVLNKTSGYRRGVLIFDGAIFHFNFRLLFFSSEPSSSFDAPRNMALLMYEHFRSSHRILSLNIRHGGGARRPIA